MIVKPSWDHRYRDANSTGELVSHDGERLAAREAADSNEVLRVLNEENVLHDTTAKTMVVIDEAHFFGESLIPVVLDLVSRGVNVVVAGVELDHRGTPFEPFPALLAHADEVVKLASRCQVCNSSARHSQRMKGGDGRIEVGGSEMYEARCRDCFKPMRDTGDAQ